MFTHVAVRNPEDIATFGLASSAFARHYSRNLGWCLFLALLRCFSSGGSPRIPIWFSIRYLAVGFPIRKSPDRSSFAAPRSLSQLITSFIGSWCQGIPLALLLAWSRRNQLRKFRKSRSAFAVRYLLPCFVVSPLKSKPASLGFWFVFETLSKALLCWFQFRSYYKKSPILVLYYSKNYAGSISEVFKTKLYSLPFNFKSFSFTVAFS